MIFFFNSVAVAAALATAFGNGAVAAPANGTLQRRFGPNICVPVDNDFTNGQLHPGYDVTGRLEAGPNGFKLFSSNPTETSRVKYNLQTFNGPDSLARTIVEVTMRTAPDFGKESQVILGNPRCVEGPPSDCDQIDLLTYVVKDSVSPFSEVAYGFAKGGQPIEFQVGPGFTDQVQYDAFDPLAHSPITQPDPGYVSYTYKVELVRGRSIQFTMTDLNGNVLGQSPVITDKVPDEHVNLYISMNACDPNVSPECAQNVNFLEVQHIRYTICVN